MSYFDALTPGSMTIILVGVTMLGGAIGSFLNVVIYRLPAGLSLIRPPSRCPRCEHPIRSHDNLPVFGWILLRGKCRDCGEPISARYPTIEAIVAMMFLAVAWLEWFGPRYLLGLPVREFIGNDVTISGLPPLEALITRVGLHLLLLTTLLCVGMVEWDHDRISDLIWGPVIFASMWICSPLPSLAIWPAWGYQTVLMSGVIDGVVGAVAGLAVGVILSQLNRLRFSTKEQLRERESLLISCLSIGLVLGWQMIALIGLAYLPILFVAVLLQRMKVTKSIFPYGLCLFVLTLASIVALATGLTPTFG